LLHSYIKKENKEYVFPLTSFPIDSWEPLSKDGVIIQSRVAIKFHELLREKIGLLCDASFAYGGTKINALFLLVNDNDISEEILQHKTHVDIYPQEKYFDSIVQMLYLALKEVEPKIYEKIKDSLYSNGKVSNSMWISIKSLDRLRMNYVYSKSAIPIEAMFKEKFPQYQHLICCCYSLSEYDTFADHLFLFFTPSDLEKARSNGDLEKMIEEAYTIVKKNDHLGLFTEEIYRSKLQVNSRRNFTKDDLFCMLRGK